jgi:hypothetical protein
VSQAIPIIYAPPTRPSRLNAAGRLMALLVGLLFLAPLLLASWLPPAHDGSGTHQRMGFIACQTLTQTGVPCPTCGMTTSFAWFARGNFPASIYVQPGGFMLALASGVGFWVSLYIAATGRPVHRLMSLIRARWYVIPLIAVILLAWGWKIWIHARGLDGW